MIVADKGKICPLFRKDVSKVCHTCAWFVEMIGTNPQTGEPVTRAQCALTAQVMATLEAARGGHAAAATTQELRNDIVRREQHSTRILSQQPAIVRLIGKPVDPYDTESGNR